MSKILSDEAMKRLRRKITHRHRVLLHRITLTGCEYNERDNWCRENLKQKSWRTAKTMHDEWMWCFGNAEDAMAFKLRWL